MLLLTGALVAPYFVDWSDYRTDFERVASQVLGRKVKVMGGASARLVPFPSVTFGSVMVGDDPENPDMSIERFSMDAELAPFLKGEVLIFDMRVQRPRVNVLIGEDGTVDWALRPSAPPGVEQITLENVSITGGSVDIQDNFAKRRYLISALDATVSAKALKGPWRFDGGFDVGKEPFIVTGSTGEPDGKGELQLKLGINPVRRSMLAETDGNVSLTDGLLAYSGKFTLRPAELTDPGGLALRDGSGGTAGAPSGDPLFRVQGKFTAKQDGLTLPSIRFETGPRKEPYFADGSGRVNWGPEPRFDLVMTGAQVTFPEDGPQGASGGGTGFAERMLAVEHALAKVPLPSMPGEIKVDLPAVVAGDTTVRDVAFTASPDGDGWRLDDFKALLPGRTSLEAAGRVGIGDNFGFAGRLLIASSQPTGLSNWLVGNAAASVRQLPSVGLDAEVALTRGRQIFENVELVLGKTVLKGRVERQSEGAKPALSMTLTGGALDLQDIGALASVVVGPKNENNLADTDLDLALKAGPVSAFGLSAESVDTSFRLKGDRLDVDRLLVNGLSDSSLSGTAVLTGFPAAPQGTVDVSLLAADLAPMLAALTESYPQVPMLKALSNRSALYADFYSDAKLDLVASFLKAEAGQSDVTLSLSASAGRGIYSGTATFKGDLSDVPGLVGQASLEGNLEDPVALLALIGFATLPVEIDGPLMFSAAAAGSMRSGFKANADVKSNALNASVSGNWSVADGGPAGRGSFSAQSADAGPYLMASGNFPPGVGGGLPLRLSGDFESGDGLLRLTSVNGAVADSGVSADISISLGARPVKIDGKAAVSRLDLGFLGETLLGAATLAGEGTDWPEAKFSERGFFDLEGLLSVSADSAAIGADAAMSGAEFLLGIKDNEINLTNFSASYRGGALKGSLSAKNNVGTGLVNADFTLFGAPIPELTGQGTMSGLADIAGTVSATGKSALGIVSALSGTGTLKLRDVEITGINPSGLRSLVEKAEGGERPPEGGTLADLVSAQMRGGRIEFAEADLSWVAASGAARISPLSVNAEGGTLTARSAYDFGKQKGEVTGQFAFAAGKDAVAGAEPVLPFTVTLERGVYSGAFDDAAMGQFFAQRSLEREQAKVEAMQEDLLEGQRLRREVRYFAHRRAQETLADLVRRRAQEETRARAAAIIYSKQIEAEKLRREALEKDVLQIEEEAAKKAAEAASAQKPAAPAQIEIDPQVFQEQSGGTSIFRKLNLSPTPLPLQ